MEVGTKKVVTLGFVLFLFFLCFFFLGGGGVGGFGWVCFCFLLGFFWQYKINSRVLDRNGVNLKHDI